MRHFRSYLYFSGLLFSAVFIVAVFGFVLSGLKGAWVAMSGSLAVLLVWVLFADRWILGRFAAIPFEIPGRDSPLKVWVYSSGLSRVMVLGSLARQPVLLLSQGLLQSMTDGELKILLDLCQKRSLRWGLSWFTLLAWIKMSLGKTFFLSLFEAPSIKRAWLLLLAAPWQQAIDGALHVATWQEVPDRRFSVELCEKLRIKSKDESIDPLSLNLL